MASKSPISKGDTATEVVDIAFISSPLWKHVNRFRLLKSQRDKNDPQYAAYVQQIGQDRVPHVTKPDGRKLIPLNNHSEPNSQDHFQLQCTTHLDELKNFVYPNMSEDAGNWNDRDILATTNATTDECNDSISSNRPGESVSFFSSDSCISDESNPNTAFAAPEHLNELNVSGVPPHELKLKSNTLAMLVRNLNFSAELATVKSVFFMPSPAIVVLFRLNFLPSRNLTPSSSFPEENSPRPLVNVAFPFHEYSFPCEQRMR